MATFAPKGAVTVTVLVHCRNQLNNDPNGLGNLQISSERNFDANKLINKGSMLT